MSLPFRDKQEQIYLCTSESRICPRLTASQPTQLGQPLHQRADQPLAQPLRQGHGLVRRLGRRDQGPRVPRRPDRPGHHHPDPTTITTTTTTTTTTNINTTTTTTSPPPERNHLLPGPGLRQRLPPPGPAGRGLAGPVPGRRLQREERGPGPAGRRRRRRRR